MINRLILEDILFLDIETVPEVEHYENLDEVKQELWAAKSQYQRKDEFTAEAFYDRAGIWAEFGKIICISVGFFSSASGVNRSFRVKSFTGDEPDLLPRKRAENTGLALASQWERPLQAADRARLRPHGPVHRPQ